MDDTVSIVAYVEWSRGSRARLVMTCFVGECSENPEVVGRTPCSFVDAAAIGVSTVVGP